MQNEPYSRESEHRAQRHIIVVLAGADDRSGKAAIQIEAGVVNLRWACPLLLNVVLAGGCSSVPPVTFPPGEIAIEQAARIEGASEDEFSSIVAVRLEEIDGKDSLFDWSSDRSYALVKPGSYVFTVRYVDMISKPGLVQLSINANDLIRNEYTRRRLFLTVHAGYSYQIHFRKDPVRYFLNRVRTTDYSHHMVWDAPWTAKECFPQKEEPDDLPLACDGPRPDGG